MPQRVLVIDTKILSFTIDNSQGYEIPCFLAEGGCSSTSLEPYAYNCEPAENFIVTKTLTNNKLLKPEKEPG